MKKALVVMLLSAVMLTGCGSGGGGSNGAGFDVDMTTNSGVSSSDYMQLESLAKSSGSSSVRQESSTSTTSSESTYEPDSDLVESSELTLNKEMLVYRGNLTITSDKYEKSLEAISSLYNDYDCFIEESYEHMDSNDMHTYTATIRVRSRDYDAFMNGASSAGVVESKRSSVENMTMEYSDITTALRIYRAREQRLINLLEETSDMRTAMDLEEEIADIEIDIAQYESRKALIETDVAYSYVNITLRETKMYEAQIAHTDSFFVRLWKHIVNTLLSFLEFLEILLFVIIALTPYVLLVVLVWVLSRKLNLWGRVLAFKEKHTKPKYPNTVARYYPPNYQNNMSPNNVNMQPMPPQPINNGQSVPVQSDGSAHPEPQQKAELLEEGKDEDN